MASKRKAEEDTNPNPSKRIKITENNFNEAVPFEILEIFALIAKNLLNKPRTLINLSRINSRTHHNMYSTSVWCQLGFEALADSPNGVDPFALLITLQKLEHKRLVEKSRIIEQKIEAQVLRCENRNTTRSTELANFKEMINAKLGITNEHNCIITNSFYEELVVNNTLTKEYITSIGKLIRREETYSLAPVTFEAITLAVTKSKKEVLSSRYVEEYENPEVEYATVKKGFRRPKRLKEAQTARKEFAENLFIFCTSFSSYEHSNYSYSCFMKYIGDNQVVVFVSQHHGRSSAFLHYWKIDLTTKKLLDFGSVFQLAKKKQVLEADIDYMSAQSFSKIRQVFNDILECKLEYIYGLDLELLATDCMVRDATIWTDTLIGQYY